MKILLWIAPPVLCLTACQKAPSDESAASTRDAYSALDAALSADPESSNVANSVQDTAGYLAKAADGDLFEILTSRAIESSTHNAAIKDFAHTMVAAHQQSTAKLKAAALKAGLTVKQPRLDAARQHQLDAIRKASGQDADRLYLEAQRKAHEEALALHQGYAAEGDQPDLKKAAGDIADVVHQHQDMLAKLSS